MEEQAEYKQGPGLIYQKIAAISKEVTAITKSKENKQQGFMFRGIDDVYNALQPLLAKHEVFTIPVVLEDRSEERQTKSGGTLIYRILKLRYTMYASDGSSVHGVVIGEGMDSGDKAANKAMAVGHKYFILQTFCVPTQDMKDPDAESHEVKSINQEVITPKQVKEISDLIAETNSDNERFWSFAGAKTVDKIPAQNYQKVVSKLREKAKQIGA